jgi:hypothetical protein
VIKKNYNRRRYGMKVKKIKKARDIEIELFAGDFSGVVK